jgi:hypothetical protein
MLGIPGRMTEIVKLRHREGMCLVSKVILFQGVEQDQQGIPVGHQRSGFPYFLSFHCNKGINEKAIDIL